MAAVLSACVAAEPPGATPVAAPAIAARAEAPARGQGAIQLAASVQKDLDFLGFREVDAQSLTLRQLGAIRSLQNEIAFGPRFIDARYRLQAILRTDGFTTFDGTRVEGTRRGRF
ncbi:MAG: hypothetical protein AAF390_11510 [Pseudomonadota bacterium]